MSDNATLIKRLDAARMVLALGDMYPQHEAALIDAIARIAELESALRPFTKLRKVEQFKTAVLVEDDLITVVVRVGDIKAALAALSGEEKPRSRSTIS